MKLGFLHRATAAALCATGDFGMTEAIAQERVWFEDSDTSGESFGWLRVGPDLDGDSVNEFTLSAAYGKCVYSNQGWAAVHSVANGEVQRWCGTGASTAFHGGTWIGDVDMKGVSDIVIGEPYYYDPVQFGRDTGRLLVFSTETGALLYEIVGTQTDGRLGNPVVAIDDIDGDSINDLLVGARSYGVNGNGSLLVYSMASGALIRRHDGGFQHRLGYRIAVLGDVDGDGVGDYAGSAEALTTGRVQVFSGRTGAKLAQLDGQSGVYDAFGSSIASGGDLDGDGLDDLLISGAAPFSGKWGNIRDGRIEAWSIASNRLIWTITGSNGEWFGEVLCGIGDVNGDGFREILVTAGWDDHDGRDIGRVDLISGRSHRSLFRFYAGIAGLLSYGEMLTPGADFDGDGREDLVIGTAYGGTNESEGGHVAIYAGNDLFLQADPLEPGSAETVTVDLRGGEPFTLGLIALTAIDGAPLFAPLLLGPFDANGEIQLLADTDPALSGHRFTLLSYAEQPSGRGPLMISSPQVVAVQ